jgi:phosphoribosylglycinamide formyltransferase-1
MARLAVFTSGNGSNFQAIAEKILLTGHTIACMICDRKDAYSFTRAENLGIKSYHVSYFKKEKEEAEKEIIRILENENVNLVALAGFMRLISPFFIDKYRNRIVNIHPALLPKYPGTHGIEESFNSGDNELGITIHYVEEGMDSGPVIMQKSFFRNNDEAIEEIEKKIHKIEHIYYPEVIEKLLDNFST